ncbi:hypothetical protein [Flavobacterium sp. GCM10027622]|uniref:hypothetical protein n=1 Tax=unclassified Flavobacterium TaxID=196869 RepID=UPI003613D3EA
MKNFFLTLLLLSALLWLGLRYYNHLNSITLFSNQAVFEINLAINENEVDAFFGLPSGTFDKNKHSIICKLPVTVPSFTKPMNKIVSLGPINMNCNEKYDNKIHTKYDNAELNDNNAVLMIVGNTGLIEITDFDLPIAGKVYATKVIHLDYKRGKINHFIISKDGISDYCK